MPTARADDLRAFRDFLDAKLVENGDALTPGDALALWEIENATDEERAETLAAIRRGLEDVEAGRVVDAREAIAALRRKYGFPELP